LAAYWFFNKATNQDGYKTEGIKPNFESTIESINFANDESFSKQGKDFPKDHFSCQWTGVILIEEAGKYTFSTRSDDGSRLWVNGKRIVNNWGLHGAREKKGRIYLKEGWHNFKSTMFENAGGASMIVRYSGPDTKNKMELLTGAHDSKKEEDEKILKKEKKVSKAAEPVDDNGFIAKYWFFEKGTDQNGYKTEGTQPSLIITTETINF